MYKIVSSHKREGRCDGTIIICMYVYITYIIYVQPLTIDHAVDKSCDIRSL